MDSSDISIYQEVNVSAKISGRVEDILVVAGDTVGKDDMLMRIVSEENGF